MRIRNHDAFVSNGNVNGAEIPATHGYLISFNLGGSFSLHLPLEFIEDCGEGFKVVSLDA